MTSSSSQPAIDKKDPVVDSDDAKKVNPLFSPNSADGEADDEAKKVQEDKAAETKITSVNIPGLGLTTLSTGPIPKHPPKEKAKADNRKRGKSQPQVTETSRKNTRSKSSQLTANEGKEVDDVSVDEKAMALLAKDQDQKMSEPEKKVEDITPTPSLTPAPITLAPFPTSPISVDDENESSQLRLPITLGIGPRSVSNTVVPLRPQRAPTLMLETWPNQLVEQLLTFWATGYMTAKDELFVNMDEPLKLSIRNHAFEPMLNALKASPTVGLEHSYPWLFEKEVQPPYIVKKKWESIFPKIHDFIRMRRRTRRSPQVNFTLPGPGQMSNPFTPLTNPIIPLVQPTPHV